MNILYLIVKAASFIDLRYIVFGVDKNVYLKLKEWSEL